MRIVLDTNVLMSAIFWQGTPRKLLEAWQQNLVTFVASREIIEEYERVESILRERYPKSAQHAGEVMQRILTDTEVIVAPPLPETVCTDPDDDKFIACALAGSSIDAIVTGDKALLVGGNKVGVSTMKPGAFLARLTQR